VNLFFCGFLTALAIYILIVYWYLSRPLELCSHPIHAVICNQGEREDLAANDIYCGVCGRDLT
jgi:hypothetical protein